MEKVKRESFPSDELGKYGGIEKETGEEPWILVAMTHLQL